MNPKLLVLMLVFLCSILLSFIFVIHEAFAAKKRPAKKPAAKKAAPKKTTVKKPAAKKSAPKKTAAKKPAKKPAKAKAPRGVQKTQEADMGAPLDEETIAIGDEDVAGLDAIETTITDDAPEEEVFDQEEDVEMEMAEEEAEEEAVEAEGSDEE